MSFPLPNNWHISGLASTKKILVLTPWEKNPPGTPKALVGVDPETGNILWEHPTSGFMFTPPIADEELACAIDSHGILVAVHPANGKAVWRSFPELGDFPHRGIPPVLSKEHVLAVQPESRGAGLLAFNRTTGALAWEFQPPENATVDFAPSIWNDSAFVLAGEWQYSVSLKDGTWSRLSKSERKSSQGWYFASPVVDEDQVYLLEANYVNKKLAYVLQARDASTGQSKWKMDLKRRPYQPPVVYGDHVYFVDRDGELYCLNKEDGQVHWQESLGAEPADAPVALQDRICVLTKDGNLNVVTFPSPTVDISQSPDVYKKQGEWVLAAGAYLINGDPFEAGLALLKANDYRQASLAFKMDETSEQKITRHIESLLARNEDEKAGTLCEDWGKILLEQQGRQAQGNIDVAKWFEQAANNYILANHPMDSFSCRERAAQVMETPRIKVDVIADENVQWVVNEAILLHLKVSNIGYGPARRVTIKLGGNIKKPFKSHSFVELGVDQSQNWDNVRIVPNSSGAGLLEFELEYESYRTGDVLQKNFTHPIHVEKKQTDTLSKIFKQGSTFHIEKFFSPGATHNDIEISDSGEFIIGDNAQINKNPMPVKSSESNKEKQMDPAVTLVTSALISGLTAGLTDTAKTTVKDMYESLKARLVKKAEKNEDAQDAIAKFEKQPDSKARQNFLKEELGKLELDKDDEVLKLAQSLLDVLKETGDKGGKYNVDIQNSQGIVVGDNANVTQNIENTSKKK